MSLIEERELAVRTAVEAMDAAHQGIEKADESADLEALERSFDEAKEQHDIAVTDLRKAKQAEERKLAVADAIERQPVKPVEDTPVEERKLDVRVGKEPLTYERGMPGRSFFGDYYAANKQGDTVARARLDRHMQEMAVEKRAITTSDGAGGEFVPPLWAQQQWVKLARSGRAVANTLNHMPLPAGTDTINLPTVSTGTAVAVQTDGGSVQSTDLATSSVTGAVQTIAGMQDVSQQLVDFSVPGIDVVIFDDLARAYNSQLDTKVINGSVTNAKGLLQLSGINASTYTDASPTVPEAWPKFADAIQLIHTNRYLPPSVIAMHPRRWGWFLASLDSSNRPLIVPSGQGYNQAGVFERVASEEVVGNVQGLPVIVDPNIPSTNGAGTNEDAILVYRAEDIYLYETETPRFRVFEEVLSGTLQVRFQVYGYYAIIAGRYPKSISKISGTGLTAPTF